MKSVLEHVRRNVVGYIALFVALGGTGYAAVTLPQGSVGARQLKNHAIEPIKLSPKFINGNVRAWAVVTASGRVVGGGGKPEGGPPVTPGVYEISWGVKLKSSCGMIATIDFGHSPATETIPVAGGSSTPITAGYAVAQAFSGGKARHENVTSVHTFNQAGQLTSLGFDLAVVC
jgi:hypothetical protein